MQHSFSSVSSWCTHAYLASGTLASRPFPRRKSSKFKVQSVTLAGERTCSSLMQYSSTWSCTAVSQDNSQERIDRGFTTAVTASKRIMAEDEELVSPSFPIVHSSGAMVGCWACRAVAVLYPASAKGIGYFTIMQYCCSEFGSGP